MVDMFVERIIYRGNEEFLWVMNLSGKASGTESNYRISSYDSDYAESLKNDANFNIVASSLFLYRIVRNFVLRKQSGDTRKSIGVQ